MKGGSRNSGPAPDPNALRRSRDADQWVTLPPKRGGKPPKWPLPDQSEREVELWAVEWKRPQAVMWERNGQEVEVALYVRRLCEAEVPGASVTRANLVRQLQEALGLSLPGLARNRWRIDAEEMAKKQPRRRSSARGRLKVVGE